VGGRAKAIPAARHTAIGIAVAGACVLALSAFTTPARAIPEPTKECGRGEALEELGRLGLAESAYLEDLKTQATVGCGKEQLEKLSKAEASCAAAKALDDAGQKEKAKAAYVKALEAEPGAKCAAAALESTPDSDQHVWSWMATAAEDVVGAVGFVLLALACMGAAFWAFLAIQMRGRRSSKNWPARRFLRPSLEVKALDDTGVGKHLGPSTASLIRSRVKPRRSGGIDVVTGHSAFGDTLQPLGDISAQAKAAVAVVSFLFSILPRREYEASGALQEKGKRGLGISLELMNRSTQLASTTVWSHEYAVPDNEVEAFQYLTVPAAAWLDHRIATAMDEGQDLPEDPRSWALFRAGAEWQEEGELVNAKQLYEASLAIDADNLWAMGNLGVIALTEGDYPSALQLLSDALEELERISG
jgi:tetratricopeptide (TPR) repeat protein